jgi:hypothetical protein
VPDEAEGRRSGAWAGTSYCEQKSAPTHTPDRLGRGVGSGQRQDQALARALRDQAMPFKARTGSGSQPISARSMRLDVWPFPRPSPVTVGTTGLRIPCAGPGRGQAVRGMGGGLMLRAEIGPHPHPRPPGARRWCWLKTRPSSGTRPLRSGPVTQSEERVRRPADFCSRYEAGCLALSSPPPRPERAP